MKSSSVSHRLFCAILLTLALVLSYGVAGGFLTPVHAQQSGAQKTVVGKVADKADKPIKGAIVYLKDTHSLAVKSGITDDAGSFRFGQLAQNVDYQLWAESGGKKSATKTISSFDSKSQLNIGLTIDTGK